MVLGRVFLDRSMTSNSRSAPQPASKTPLWRDAWVISSVGVAALGAVMLAPGSDLPLRGVLEVILLPLVMAVFLRGVDRLGSEREQAFWIRLGRSFFFLWLAALFEIWHPGFDLPGPMVDALRMMGLLPVALALDLRPHRQVEGSPQLLRQVQLTALFLSPLVLTFYLVLAPRWTLDPRR